MGRLIDRFLELTMKDERKILLVSTDGTFFLPCCIDRLYFSGFRVSGTFLKTFLCKTQDFPLILRLL